MAAIGIRESVSGDLCAPTPGLSGARSQRTLWAAGAFVAVPVVGALLCFSHTRLLGVSMAAAACITLASVAIEMRRYPLHLMPVASFFARAAGPLFGFSVVWLIALAFQPVAMRSLIAPLLGSWLILAVVGVVMDRLRRRSRIRMAVIGDPEFAFSLARELGLAKLWGHEVVGWIGPKPAGDDESIGYLGPVDRVAELARAMALDLIIFDVRQPAGSGSETSVALLERLSSALMFSPTRLMGADRFFEEHFGHAPLATMNAVWFQSMFHPRFRAASPVLKRLSDVLIAGVVLVPAALVMALCAVAIRLSDRGSVLYRQRRVGEAGKEFDVLKLRTMRVDAEGHGAPQWANQDDQRVTAVGRVLRRLHLDELPQLFNVLKGEMSLVGPRPERPEFIAQLKERLPYYDRRLAIRPGLTGWAQVRIGYAGSDLGSAWKLAHDLYYLKHRSVAFDALIMLETLITPIRDVRMAGRTANGLFVGVDPTRNGEIVSLAFNDPMGLGFRRPPRVHRHQGGGGANASMRAALVVSAAIIFAALAGTISEDTRVRGAGAGDGAIKTDAADVDRSKSAPSSAGVSSTAPPAPAAKPPSEERRADQGADAVSPAAADPPQSVQASLASQPASPVLPPVQLLQRQGQSPSARARWRDPGPGRRDHRPRVGRCIRDRRRGRRRAARSGAWRRTAALKQDLAPDSSEIRAASSASAGGARHRPESEPAELSRAAARCAVRRREGGLAR